MAAEIVPGVPRAVRRAQQQRSRPSDEEIARLRAEKLERKTAAPTPAPAPPAPARPAVPLVRANGSTKSRSAIFTRGQKRDLALVVPAALGLTYLAHRNTHKDEKAKVGKRDSRDNRRVAAGAVGGAGLAYGVDSVVGAGLKRVDQNARDRFKATQPKAFTAAINRAQKEHGRAFGLTDERGRGRLLQPSDQDHITNRTKNTYYRTMPTKTTAEDGISGLKVPGAWAKRINSHRDLKLKSILGVGALTGGAVAARHREGVGKFDRNDAALGYGTGALTVAANYNTPERIRRARDSRRLSTAEQGLTEAKAAVKTPDKSAGVKQAARNLDAARVAAKRPPMSLRGKQLAVVGGLATGAPALYLGGRGKVNKVDRSSYDRDAAAVTTGAALPIGAAAGTKRLDRKYLAQVQADPKALAEHNAHRVKHGSPSVYGDSRWNKLYEDYPKHLAGGRYRRVAARTLAGKGLPVTMAATGALALGADRSVRKGALGWAGKHKKAIALPAGMAAAAGVQGNRQSGGSRGEQAAGAAVAGQAAFRGTGYGALKLADRADRKAIAAGYTRSQAERDKKATRRAAGMTDNPRTHEERARFARHTVDAAPGAKYRRLVGHMGGKQGWALNVAATATPAALVLAKKPVDKAYSATDTRANKLRRNDISQVGGGLVAAAGGVAWGRGKRPIERAALAMPGLLAAGQAGYDLKQDEYGWSPKTRKSRRALVGKSREYGYMEERRNKRRTVEMGAGVALASGGASHLQVGRSVARGVKYADAKGYGAQARSTTDVVRRGRNQVRAGSGKAVGVLRNRVPGLGTALDIIPAKLRPHAAVGAGALLAARAHPTHDERFVSSGRW